MLLRRVPLLAAHPSNVASQSLVRLADRLNQANRYRH